MLHLSSVASDTLFVSIKQADSIFQTGNFILLASSMNIEAEKARLLQSKLYVNPVLTAEINAYDPQNKKAFHDGKSGQKVFQFEQLIAIGGKRKAQIEFAKTNVKLAETQFNDLIRQLKFQLHNSLYQLSGQSALISTFTKQMASIDTIIHAYENQVSKGNLSLKDLVRLKGVYLNLNNGRAEVYNKFFNELATVQTILQTDQIILPKITEADLQEAKQIQQLEALNTFALQNRPDYILAIQDKQLAEQYVTINRKNAIPDVVVFSNYDQRGGAFQNQINVGISVPIPVWNRQQGNIRMAEAELKRKEFELEHYKLQILSDVRNYYAQHVQSVKEYNTAEQMFNIDFDTTLKGMKENFKKGNVSILEFVDFFESYNNAIAEMARIRIQLAVSSEQVNLSIGK